MRVRAILGKMSPYVPGKLQPGAVKLASNENPLGPSPRGMEAARGCIEGANLYPDGAAADLKTRIATCLSERAGFRIGTESIVVGNGSDELIQLCAAATVEPGANVVTSEVTFSEYGYAGTLFGGQMRYVPLKDGRFNLEAIARLVDSKTAIVYLCNPNNPTGTYFTEAELVSFLESVPADLPVVSDEAYIEYVTAGDYPTTIELRKRFPNLIILRTFSKIYGLAGFRVGYGIADPGFVSELDKVRPPFNVNIVAQAAAIAALDDQDFLARSRSLVATGKPLLYRGLERLGLHYYPSEANFICLDTGKDCMAVFESIMAKGVTIRPLKGFGLKTWIRVTVGTLEQNKLFLDALAGSI
jgi:histidinol-phosphate aminotransferase